MGAVHVHPPVQGLTVEELNPSRIAGRHTAAGDRLLLLGQRKGYHGVSGLGGILASAAGCDCDVLPAVHHIDARSGVTSRTQWSFPKPASPIRLARAAPGVRALRHYEHSS